MSRFSPEFTQLLKKRQKCFKENFSEEIKGLCRTRYLFQYAVNTNGTLIQHIALKFKEEDLLK